MEYFNSILCLFRLDFRISEWISRFQSGFQDFRLDFWISEWISGFQSGFQDFRLDFWISGFQSGFLDFRVDFWISIGFLDFNWISGFQIGFLLAQHSSRGQSTTDRQRQRKGLNVFNKIT